MTEKMSLRAIRERWEAGSWIVSSDGQLYQDFDSILTTAAALREALQLFKQWAMENPDLTRGNIHECVSVAIAALRLADGEKQ